MNFEITYYCPFETIVAAAFTKLKCYSTIASIVALAAISSITNTDYSKFATDSVDLATIIIEPRHYIAKQTFALRNHFLGYFAFRYFTVITALRVHY